jgi:hypothetical protein
MATDLYVVLETPNSGALKYLLGDNLAVDDTSTFLLPKEKQSSESFSSTHNTFVYWEAKHNEPLNFKLPSEASENKIFLFFSPFFDLSTQFEALLETLEKESFQLTRILAFIDANLLESISGNFLGWMDASAHFSDAICITNRTNQNGKYANELIKRYEQMRYPVETYILSDTNRRKMANVLNPRTRRISHAFDSAEMLEEEDTPQNDPYLRKLANGKREKTIPIPFKI